MIEVNGKQFFSKYVPADKTFFRNMHYINLLLKHEEDVDKKIAFWDIEWDLKAQIDEAKGILEEANKFRINYYSKTYKALRKQCQDIITNYESKLKKFHQDTNLEKCLEVINHINESLVRRNEETNAETLDRIKTMCERTLKEMK